MSTIHPAFQFGLTYPAFGKVPRLNREMVITEKLDGTNGLIAITDDGQICAGSRNRWLTPENDNFGFARWVEGNKTELLKLGPGLHYGEWWGAGIQRNYGLKEKRFSLFNASRWMDMPGGGVSPMQADGVGTVIHGISVVPILARGPFNSEHVAKVIEVLREHGSFAAPHFMDPEGVIVYHEASGKIFKVTCKNDESPKTKVDAAG